MVRNKAAKLSVWALKIYLQLPCLCFCIVGVMPYTSLGAI
jgi:hypothetical protein